MMDDTVCSSATNTTVSAGSGAGGGGSSSSSSSSGLRLCASASELRPSSVEAPVSSAIFRPPEAVDYEADWRSGSELSDAYESDAEAVLPPAMAGASSTRP